VLADNVKTWQQVATLLMSVDSAAEISLPEVKAAWLEFREAREECAKAVDTTFKDGCSRQKASGQPWDHSHIDSEGLVRACMRLEAFPKIEAGGAPPPAGSGTAAKPNPRMSLAQKSAAADNLTTAARRLAKLRQMLLDEAWDEVHKFVGTLSSDMALLPELAADEVRRASEELQDMAAHVEAALRESLNEGRSTKKGRAGSTSTAPPKKPPKQRSMAAADSVPLVWDHAALDGEGLEAAMAAVKAFPLQLPTGVALLKQGDFIARLRAVLIRCDWAALSALLDAVASDAELAQLDEVRAAATELDDMRAATEAELATAMQSGRSLKILGAKQQVKVDKSFFVPVEWDHSGLDAGCRRLQRAVDAVSKFPKPTEAASKMIGNAALLSELRGLILAAKMPKLGERLEAIEDAAQRRLDEVGMAWQEFLTYELEIATKDLDQSKLKTALARATAVGMLQMEKPVYKALAVFIDPPEFVGDLYAEEVWPDASGKIVLRVRVRGARSLHWVKNDIQLKEGADGGRIQGVETAELTFTKMLGRDRGQKVWCIAENKWGKVTSHKVILRLEGEGDRQGALKQAVTSVKVAGRFKAGVLGGGAEWVEDEEEEVSEQQAQRHRDAFKPALGSLKSIPIFHRTKSGFGVASERLDEEDEGRLEVRERKSTFQANNQAFSNDL